MDTAALGAGWFVAGWMRADGAGAACAGPVAHADCRTGRDCGSDADGHADTHCHATANANGGTKSSDVCDCLR